MKQNKTIVVIKNKIQPSRETDFGPFLPKRWLNYLKSVWSLRKRSSPLCLVLKLLIAKCGDERIPACVLHCSANIL